MVPTRVLHVVPHDLPGGMQEVARILASEMRGVESRILDLSSWIGARGKGHARVPRAWAGLIGELRRARVGVMVSHAPNSALFASTAAVVAGVGRRLLVVHARAEIMGEQRLAAMRSMTASGVLTDLVFVGHSVRASYGPEIVGRSRVSVIQNGVRLPRSRPSEPSPASRGVTAVCTGRLVAEKNMSVAVEAVSRARTDMHLVIYGDGPLRVELGAMADGVAQMRGNVGRDILQREYAQAQMLLFPSTSEGLPLALIEAAAAGLPVIASDMDFNREVMDTAAVYVPAHDADAWASAIDRLAVDEGLRHRLIGAGVERAEAFSVPRMVDAYERLLASPRL